MASTIILNGNAQFENPANCIDDNVSDLDILLQCCIIYLR